MKSKAVCNQMILISVNLLRDEKSVLKLIMNKIIMAAAPDIIIASTSFMYFNGSLEAV